MTKFAYISQIKAVESNFIYFREDLLTAFNDNIIKNLSHFPLQHGVWVTNTQTPIGKFLSKRKRSFDKSFYIKEIDNIIFICPKKCEPFDKPCEHNFVDLVEQFREYNGGNYI